MSLYFAIAVTSATLFGISSAGLQVPLVIINLSPHEATVDMSLDENCIKQDYDTAYLNHYYDSWEANDLGSFDESYEPLNDYLQQYKTQFGVPTLRNNLANMTGVTAIPALAFTEETVLNGVPYMVFQTEMDGSGACFGSHSRKSFNVTVDGKTQGFTLEDPPTSKWTLTMTEPNNTQIVLGSGGHAQWTRVVATTYWYSSAIASLGSVYDVASNFKIFNDFLNGVLFKIYGPDTPGLPEVFKKGILGIIDYVLKHPNEKLTESSASSDTSIDKSTLAQSFTAIYDTIDEGSREACILGLNIIGNFDCRVAGVSLIIQENGDALAVPLPNIYRAWN